MNDRRRNNGPAAGTIPPLYDFLAKPALPLPARPTRTRKPDELRAIYLRTGSTPTASGSAYLELAPSTAPSPTLIPPTSTLKLSCTVHGPRPTPRSAPYAAHATLTCHVKHAPFATRRRRAGAQVRADAAAERHLAAQLEAALRGVVCAERFPKSGVEVCVAVVEGEEDRWWGDEAAAARQGGGDAAPEAAPPGAGWGAMVVLAGCVTVAAAALVDAGVDCVGLVTGGVAALVDDGAVVLDPNPCEHERIRAACVVGYIEGRDEIAMLWQRGEVDVEQAGQLVEEAVAAAIGVREVVRDALLEDGDSEES